MSQGDIAELCQAVELVAHAGVPFISGTFPLDSNETALFYRSQDGVPGYIDFAKASQSDLEALANACQPATFGLHGRDVLDESYRKAGKMDTSNYATQFSPISHGVQDLIHEDLFNGDTRAGIRLQAYKLNVYGPGSFFKAHVDTPRGTDMFGSVVVVLPTRHEGGSLIFRHAGQQWTVDTATAVSANGSPDGRVHAPFAAFYSDVEHEVTPVISGYRVTLTYLLYFTPTPPSKLIQLGNSALEELKVKLAALLAIPEYLPVGGNLGFRLRHRYPINQDNWKSSNLAQMNSIVKGPDARVLSACEALGLGVSFRLFYEVEDDDGQKETYMTKRVVQPDYHFGDDMDEENSMGSLIKDYGGKKVQNMEFNNNSIEGDGSEPDSDPDSDDSQSDSQQKKKAAVVPICWINPEYQSLTMIESPYSYACGNEAAVGHLYGEIALVAKVGPVDNRRMTGGGSSPVV